MLQDINKFKTDWLLMHIYKWILAFNGCERLTLFEPHWISCFGLVICETNNIAILSLT